MAKNHQADNPLFKALSKKYEAQIAESYPQEDTDKFPCFTDTDGKVYAARYMPCDGYTISGEVMAAIARADIARAESWCHTRKAPKDPT